MLQVHHLEVQRRAAAALCPLPPAWHAPRYRHRGRKQLQLSKTKIFLALPVYFGLAKSFVSLTFTYLIPSQFQNLSFKTVYRIRCLLISHVGSDDKYEVDGKFELDTVTMSLPC